MTRVPLELSGTIAKAYLAEAVLKAAAQGHTSYNELVAAAIDQIQVIGSMLTRTYAKPSQRVLPRSTTTIRIIKGRPPDESGREFVEPAHHSYRRNDGRQQCG